MIDDRIFVSQLVKADSEMSTEIAYDGIVLHDYAVTLRIKLDLIFDQ